MKRYASWKNPGYRSFDGVKVSWRENRVVVRIAVLLVGVGMASFVSRNRRKKRCQRIETWMLCRAPILPKENSVTGTFHTVTGTDCIIPSPRSVTTLLSAVGKSHNHFRYVKIMVDRDVRFLSCCDTERLQRARSRYCANWKGITRPDKGRCAVAA